MLAGATLDRVRQNRADLRFAFPDRFVDRLEGATVLSVGRRAKYLLMPLSTGETWVTHLGMTGRFTLDGEMLGEFETNAPARGPHEHLSLYATGKGVATRVGYADARRFGFMGLIPTDEIEAHPWFAGLGPEPMGNAFSADHLKARFKDRRQPVKVALLDQRHGGVDGKGNRLALAAQIVLVGDFLQIVMHIFARHNVELAFNEFVFAPPFALRFEACHTLSFLGSVQNWNNFHGFILLVE